MQNGVKIISFYLFMYFLFIYICIISLTVAKEVLLAERGEQWLLSCFGPLRERPCIPGMEDVSPEEIRWEMYEAQKTGMVEQAVRRIIQNNTLTWK